MATFDKRGTVWRVQVRLKGVKMTGTFASKVDAANWAAEQEHNIRRGLMKPGSNRTVADAMNEYALRVSPLKSGRWETNRIKAFIRDFPVLAAMKLSDVSSNDFGRWRDARLAGNPAKKLKPVSTSTVLRDINLFSHVFTTARDEWKWIAESPLKGMRRPSDGEPRTRKITDAEVEQVLETLGYSELETPGNISQRIGAMFVLALETAMRRGEMIGLTWQNVFLDKRYVHLPKTKNGSARNVPLSPRAIRLLEQMSPLKDAFEGGVFGVSDGSADGLFRKARAMGGLSDFTFHDARRTALTRLASRFTVMELAKISGHRDIRILQNVYYAPEATDLAAKLQD